MSQQKYPAEMAFPISLIMSDLALGKNGDVLPILFSHRMWKPGAEAAGLDGLRLQIYQSVTDRLIAPFGGKLLPLQPDAFLVILPVAGVGDQQLIDLCNETAEYASKFCFSSVVCYLGRRARPAEALEQVHNLTRADRENVTVEEGVFRYEDIPAPPEDIPPFRHSNWMFFFLENRRDEMMKAIREYFQEAVDSRVMNRTFLQLFQQDFLQDIYYALKREGIPAHALYADLSSAESIVTMARSVAGTLDWVRKITERAADLLTVRDGGMSIAQRVCRCIRMKLDQPISRGELAELLHLSEGHIAREFKNEMGISISQYRTNMRMEMARQMLLETSLPLSAIASKTGYGDYAYFYSTFRKHFGVSPSDLRAGAADAAEEA